MNNFKKAKVDKTGQKLFIEKIAVNAIESAELTYHKGDQTIELSLNQSAYMGGISQVSILEGQTAEKWSMTGTGKEAVFIAASTEKGSRLGLPGIFCIGMMKPARRFVV